MKIDNLAADIYYQRSYSALYEKDCDYFEYNYQEGEQYVNFTALKRRIDSVAGFSLQEELYDLETPYGYGGPLSNSDDPAFLQRAFSSYRSHCIQQRIVCEFVRFHPFNTLSKQVYLFDMHFLERRVVIVDLELDRESRRKQYSKTTRNIVKKASKNLTFRDDTPLSEFITLYYETMKKNSASDFFYFNESYFEALKALDGVRLLSTLKGNKCTSSGFFICVDELAHYHLSANNQELVRENGNYLLLDAAFEYAKAQGCRYMMLGGGRTSSPDDSLYKFKAKFSHLTKPFYIAGLDFQPDKRRQLNQLWKCQNPARPTPPLFQLYRA